MKITREQMRLLIAKDSFHRLLVKTFGAVYIKIGDKEWGKKGI